MYSISISIGNERSLPATTEITEETESSNELLMSTTSNEQCAVDDDEETRLGSIGRRRR